MSFNKGIATIFATFCLLLLSPSAEAVGQKGVLKIGFITVGPINDLGYNYAHEQGRLFLQAALAGRVETSVAEKIPESAEVERVMEKMIAKGVRLIFSTSYGYLEPTLRVAKRHPEVKFECCGRPVPANLKNVASYSARQYEPMYVCGIVAGRMTKKNHLGFLIAHPVPQLVQDVNAFTLGVQSINKRANVHVVCTNTWSDPALEAEATKGLIESGADVIAMHLDSPLTVLSAAEKYGVMTVGYHADLKSKAPNGWLTGEVWNWGPLYENIAKSVLSNIWMPGNFVYEMKDGSVKLASFGKVVPPKVQLQALKAVSDLQEGSAYIFRGPLCDRDGKERIGRGKTADAQILDNMNWFVPGVEGVLDHK